MSQWRDVLQIRPAEKPVRISHNKHLIRGSSRNQRRPFAARRSCHQIAATRAPESAPPVVQPHDQCSQPIRRRMHMEQAHSRIRVANGRVYCLPDVRAHELPDQPFPTPPLSSPHTSDRFSYCSSDEDSTKTGTADVSSFYGRQKQEKRNPVAGGRAARSCEPAAATSAVPDDGTPERAVSPADSIAAIYSSEEEEVGQGSPEESELSHYYAVLSDARHQYAGSVFRPSTDYLNDLRESLHRVAEHQGVDLTPAGVREQIRKRERQEIADQLQAQLQTDRLRDSGFDSSSGPLAHE